LSNEADGLDAVAAFARTHGRPMSIPEWGLVPRGSSGGGGDDPTYVEGIASIIDHDGIVYNSYFDHPGEEGTIPITDAPRSLAAYRVAIVHDAANR
jgi:hypothetical protein